MTSAEFESRIVNWARNRSGVEALIQIGSRVQVGAEVDQWSDWDYHLIVHQVAKFQTIDWPSEIAPCLSVHLEKTERAIEKLTAVFADGFEVDVIPLSAWQMKLVYWAMARPSLKSLFPRRLTEGVRNTQLIVRPGHNVLFGGAAWEKRLAALSAKWPERKFSSDDFENVVSGFWRHVVWVQKKIMRGECRAAQRWLFKEVIERRWSLLEEEARLEGKVSRPEARKAEHWLSAERLEQTNITTSADQHVLSRALLAEISLFEEISKTVASTHGFSLLSYSKLADWLRSELGKLAEPNEAR